MSNSNSSIIAEAFDSLLTFIEALPVSLSAKEYLKAKVVFDFFDSWHFDDESNTYTFSEYIANPSNHRFIDIKATMGIVNIVQLNRYLDNFTQALKKSRSKSLVQYLKALDNKPLNTKLLELSKQLSAVTRSEVLEKHGIKNIVDPEWNNQIKEILQTEISFAKEQSDIITKSKTPYQATTEPSAEQFAVDVIESRLAAEAVDYQHKFENFWETYKFDPNYFDTYISGSLLEWFTKFIYEKIKPLNNYEISRYLTISLQQFQTHTPPKRHQAFAYIFFQTYWHPNHMEFTIGNKNDPYISHIWRCYNNHFSLFKETLQRIYDDFRAGQTGVNQPPVPIIQKVVVQKTPLSFNYPQYNSNLSNITDLWNNLKKNALIAEDTELKNFRCLFNKIGVGQKLKWIGNISELSFFIKTLHNTAKKVEDTKQKQWLITINSFEMLDGTVLTNDKLRGQKTPANFAIIEKAIKLL